MLNLMIYNSSLLAIAALFLTAGNVMAADLKTIPDAILLNSSKLSAENFSVTSRSMLTINFKIWDSLALELGIVSSLLCID